MPSVNLPASEQQLDGHFFGGNVQARPRLHKPLRYAGTLDNFTHQDVTPVIGREYEGLQVRDLLKWGDDMIRDLAVTGEPHRNLIWRLRVCRARLTQCSLPSQSPNGVWFSFATKTSRQQR